MTEPPHISAFTSAPLILASRASPLAMAQTAEVQHALQSAMGTLPTTITPLTTQGDAELDRPLAEIGGKGLFVKTLEQALLAGQADAAVHSGKDVETALAPDTAIAAILPRGDRRDALVGAYANLDALPKNARIGTASVRRAAALRQHRPDIVPVLLRGNVHSRLQALEAGAYDAIILAMAGLNRLGITADVHPLAEAEMLPAAAQGAILVQAPVPPKKSPKHSRQKYVQTHLAKIHDAISGAEVAAERRFLATLDGSCRTPIAASAHISGDKIHFRGWLAALDGSKIFTDETTAPVGDGENIAQEMGQKLLAQAGGVLP